MSERARPPRRPSWTAVFATTTAAFLTVLAVLAFQMRANADPAQTAKASAEAAAQPARRVLVRKLVVTRHVVVVEDDGEPELRTVRTTELVPARSPSPAQAAPAPAPAPAPVTTRTS